MPTNIGSAWQDDTPDATIWETEAEALAAEAKYAAEQLFEALLDEERNVVSYATIDDLIAARTDLEAIFTALDG